MGPEVRRNIGVLGGTAPVGRPPQVVVVRQQIRSIRRTNPRRTMISDETRVTPRSGEIAAKVIDGEAIIMNLSNGLYYSMDPLGAAVWTMAQSGLSVGRIAEALAEHFDLGWDAALRDVEELVAHLVSEELVDVAAGGASPTGEANGPVPDFAAELPYSPPVLNRYDDMADLLALDPPMPGLAGTGFND